MTVETMSAGLAASRPRGNRRPGRHSTGQRIAFYAFWAVLMAATFLPILWMVLGSFKSNGQQLAVPPVIIPDPLTVQPWLDLFNNASFLKALWNSTFISVVSCMLTLLMAIPAAYSFSRFRVGGSALLIFVMVVRLMPPTGFMIPFFVIARELGLYDTKLILIAVYTFFNLPIAIWFLLGYMSAVPRELEESAKIDNCGYFDILVRIVVPLLGQGIAAVVILILLQTWSEFPLALVLTSRNAQTLPILVNSFVSSQSISWGPMCAAGIVSALPIVLLGFFVQRFMVQGLTAGAVKG